MYAINQFGIQLYGNITHGSNQLININYRSRILEALKQNLESLVAANGFPVEINNVDYGDDSTQLRDRQILITSVRDVAVVEYQGSTVNRNSFLVRSKTKLRNFYVTFKLYVKMKNNLVLSGSDMQYRENYVDEIIKGLYGYNERASQLKTLLLNGIQNDFGLVAYEITETKSYNLKGDTFVRFESLFQYKEKYY